MRLLQPVRRLLVAGILLVLPACDVIAGHGNVGVINGTQLQLSRVQLVFESGDESSGAVAPGVTVHFTGITAGPVTAYGYVEGNGTAVASAAAALADGQTITLTLTAH